MQSVFKAFVLRQHMFVTDVWKRDRRTWVHTGWPKYSEKHAADYFLAAKKAHKKKAEEKADVRSYGREIFWFIEKQPDVCSAEGPAFTWSLQ